MLIEAASVAAEYWIFLIIMLIYNVNHHLPHTPTSNTQLLEFKNIFGFENITQILYQIILENFDFYQPTYTVISAFDNPF